MVSKHFAISIHKMYEKFCLCSTSLNLSAFTSISVLMNVKRGHIRVIRMGSV